MTAETLEVAFGFVMDGAAILAIVVYMPIANFIIKMQEMEAEIDSHKMYWWENEDNEPFTE